ncbi:hypothetical protein [Methanoregula sp.]|uniref:hypothetical protein n=1 Tax=Methanoregula sp. TaxID=2052170 RepID=UPI000CB456BE|nr:hypothetical protein [Methanoregula sp.]PKG32141.1 MAG: hypothetical protein CW742_09715 [Methanoregula sp.]
MTAIRKGFVPLFIIIVVVLAGTGCLGREAPASPDKAPPALLIDYHRTGGFAGVDDHLLLFDNGAGLISTRSITREFQLNNSELQRLDLIFRQAGFASLEDAYTSPRGGDDFMAYRITFGNKTVVTEDTVVPFTLQSVIRELNAIITSRSTPDLAPALLANMRT